LSMIAKSLFEDEDADLEARLRETMEQLTHRLNLTLG